MNETINVEMSPTVGKLFEALAAAQGELGGAKKDAMNPHLKSKYADLASIVDASKLVLPKHKLCVIQTTRAHGMEAICLVTTLGHASGEWIRGELVLPVVKKDAQGFGSALTYARRYGHASIVGIAPEDDDGAAAVGTPKPSHGPIKAPEPDLSAPLAASLGVDALAVELQERIAFARTAGELMDAWEHVNAAAPKLSKKWIDELRAMKDMRKLVLKPVAAAE